ncbi:hypothetical protein F8388_012957 [Cannabis sativa]|uniref:Longin domain-containing protein n=1 Tax=Cannabis sativa TaxID=3483 RepID=A0A7J6EA34_CANSA|nr:hypothetical protein F8388_012957 [Cannabis sativa]KAF4393702.1 hypothetical protein G4B88_007688 [Cannabis sativa]
MTQEAFIYSFVARGTMILAEYTEFTGNFPAIAAQCLHKLPSSNNKFTYTCDHHTFNFLVEDGYAYCVVAKEAVSKHISIAFLERMKADFKTRYGGGKADTAIAKSLNKEFGPIMKEHMKYIIDHAEEIEKLLKVKAQVSEVKSIMLENIDKKFVLLTLFLLTSIFGKGDVWSLGVCSFDMGGKSVNHTKIENFALFILFRVRSKSKSSLASFSLKIALGIQNPDVQMLPLALTIDRGENLTILVDKTEDLRSQASCRKNNSLRIAQQYKSKGTQIRRKMWYQNMKIKLVVLGVLLLLVLVIWLSICHGFNCTN